MSVNTQEVRITSTPWEYGEVQVWIAERWADQWERDYTLLCLSVEWSSCSSISSATFVRHYGHVKPAHETAFSRRLKDLDYQRWYVKVKVPTVKDDSGEWQYRTWYGVLYVNEDDQGGVITTGPADAPIATATGSQTLTAYGLEKLLSESPIRTTEIWNAGIGHETIQRALTFNRGGRPNRSDTHTHNSAYVFDGDASNATQWTTRTIVDYLLANCMPLDKTETRLIEWEASGLEFLPTWDRPIVDMEDTTAFEILNQLASASKMLGWHISGVDELTDPQTVQIEFYSCSHEDVLMPTTGNPAVLRNTEERELITDDDPLTHVVVKDSGLPCYEQVICRGARKRAVGSFAFDDSTLSIGWDSTYQDLYDQGAVANATAAQITAYNDLTEEEQHRANATARSSPKYDKVYSLLLIPKEWDGRVGDGIGGTQNLMIAVGDVPYWGELFAESRLPLLVGEDYSGDRVANGEVSDFATIAGATGIAEEMKPFAVFRRPDDTSKWLQLDHMGALGKIDQIDEQINNTISVSMDTSDDIPGFYLRCSGDQHAIAKTDFTPLPEDKDVGGWDFRNMIATISIQTDRYVEGAYPEDGDLPDVDVIRRKIIDAGDEYRSFYVAPQTVLGVDIEGALVRSDGGWVPANQETELQLQALAKMAFSFWGREHRTLGITTQRILQQTDIDVGDLITTIGTSGQTGGHYETVNVVVTNIKVTWPIGEGENVGNPQMAIETGFGELDAIRIAGRRQHVARSALDRPW